MVGNGDLECVVQKVLGIIKRQHELGRDGGRERRVGCKQRGGEE